MNNTKSPFAMSPKNKLISAIACIIIGILLIVFRRSALDLLVKIVGLIMIIGGLIVFLGGRVKARSTAGTGISETTLACAAIIVGLIFIIGARGIVNIFPIIMGIILLITGLSNLTGTLTLSDEARGSSWTFSLILSIVVLILGLLVLFHPGAIANAIVFFVGVSVLIGGINQLLVYLKTRKDDPIDVTFREV